MILTYGLDPFVGGRSEATRILKVVTQTMDIIENHAYHRRCLMYKGLIVPSELLDLGSANDLDIATLGYGLGNWYSAHGDKARAFEIFGRVVDGPYWPAFGFIAAEVELCNPNG